MSFCINKSRTTYWISCELHGDRHLLQVFQEWYRRSQSCKVMNCQRCTAKNSFSFIPSSYCGECGHPSQISCIIFSSMNIELAWQKYGGLWSASSPRVRYLVLRKNVRWLPSAKASVRHENSHRIIRHQRICPVSSLFLCWRTGIVLMSPLETLAL